MNFEVIEALGQIAREKNVDKKLVIDTLAAGLVAAVRKKHGATAEVDVLIDEENRTLGAYLLKNVVDDVEDPVLEASLEEAQRYDPDIDVGHVLRIEVPLEEFGRTAIQAVKQVVVQRVREAERERVFEDYHNKVGEVVTGSVQQVDRGNLVVNLGRTEALLPYREQIPREMYRQGDTIRAVIVDVQKNTKGPQLILSRTHPSFLEQLFRVEVPEVYEGIVEIRAVAREAGLRSKIAVFSNDDRIDPVGACVGMKGSRVQAVVRELSGERIDIIPWSGDSKVFVTRSLSPAKVTDIEVDEAEKTMRVSVAEGQLSLAIGKKGQNARLAAKLTGWKIDLVKEEEEEILSPLRDVDESGIPMIGVENLPGVGPRIANKLIQEGFVYVQDLRKADIEALCQVPGVGEKTAEKILESADIMIEEAEKAVLGEEGAEVESSEGGGADEGGSDDGEEPDEDAADEDSAEEDSDEDEADEPRPEPEPDDDEAPEEPEEEEEDGTEPEDPETRPAAG
ncbi:MAG: transcription termination factor NusA [Candidatus Eisenbacteria bacterium]|nr:transcription termination factor NusA [Candidatus Eisenbacteria bacterium]